jgi:hypothetical protein
VAAPEGFFAAEARGLAWLAEAVPAGGPDAARNGADPQLIDAVRGFLLQATRA